MRILVACHDITVAGGLFRFERFGRAIQKFGHELAFLAFASDPQSVRRTEFPVLALDVAFGRHWDATFAPGAGFPDGTIEAFAQLNSECFGTRVQHVLNDQTRRHDFLKLNKSFAPHLVIFNNRDWQPGDFADFTADTFHWLEGGVDVEALAGRPRPARTQGRGEAFVVGGLANKNVVPLLEAVRMCGEGMRLHLFGPTGDLPTRAPDLVADGRLRLFGVIGESDLASFYASVDCVAHTEIFAGWANLAAEAMAAGVPVICTPHGTKAFAENEATALVLEKPTSDLLANAIARLRCDPVLAQHLVQRARERISGFSWTDYSARLLCLLGKEGRGHASAPPSGLVGSRAGR